jgi:hypothetical protein
MIKFVTAKLIHFVVLVVFLFTTEEICARDNFTDLNKNSFYKKEKVKQFLILGGGYKSDYNSREYEVMGGYKYKSNKYLHEIDFLHEVTETSTTRKFIRKTEELYDFEASSRMLLGESKNYLNFYNRLQYDEKSKFYYDVSSAVGLGKLFMDGKVESSINFGYNDVKNFNSEIIVIGILKSTVKLTQNIKFSTRGLLVRAEDDYDEEIKNVVSFRIEKNLFFEIIHRYDKSRYVKSSKKLGTYRVSRSKREAYARLKYNF